MKITKELVMERLRIDNTPSNSLNVVQAMDDAKAALSAGVGNIAKNPPLEDTAPEFEHLTDQFITEYVRAEVQGADNYDTQMRLICQIEGLYRGSIG